MGKLSGMFVICFVLGQICFGQTAEQRETIQQEINGKLYTIDEQPDFPGGMKKFYKHVSQHMQYPEDAKNQGIEGKVFVSFIIDSTGMIKQDEIKVIKGLSASCNAEAIRLIKSRPQWLPAYNTKLEKKVSVRMVLPIAFSL